MMPGPPPKHPKQTRHPARVVALARRMYGDGDAWTPPQIRRYLIDAGHVASVSENTVRRWVVPGWERRHNLNRSRAAAARRAKATADLDRQMLALRARGLPYSAIAVVVEMYHGERMDAEKARYRLRKLGVAPMPGKSAAIRRRWAGEEPPWRSQQRREEVAA